MLRAIVVALFIVPIYGAIVNPYSRTEKPIIKSCCDVTAEGSYFSTSNGHSGVYNIVDLCARGPLVQGYCDTYTDGGGWLIIQRRRQQYRSSNFHRFWVDYERGFGSLYSEFWYGLKALNCLTNRGVWELRIDITFTNRTKSYLHYNYFRVGPASDNYRLYISGFTGITPTDPFTTYPLNTCQFSTRDRDNDGWAYGNCAVSGHRSTAPGGWWHDNCFHINLNYNYGGPQGIMYLGGTWYSPTSIEMKIRPTSNCGH